MPNMRIKFGLYTADSCTLQIKFGLYTAAMPKICIWVSNLLKTNDLATSDSITKEQVEVSKMIFTKQSKNLLIDTDDK